MQWRMRIKKKNFFKQIKKNILIRSRNSSDMNLMQIVHDLCKSLQLQKEKRVNRERAQHKCFPLLCFYQLKISFLSLKSNFYFFFLEIFLFFMKQKDTEQNRYQRWWWEYITVLLFSDTFGGIFGLYLHVETNCSKGKRK